MELDIFQVDAFTEKLFGGNPAAIIPLERWLPDELLQQIAAENNLSETAYIVASENGETDYHLRWFTPASEVDLCGHATLATGHVLFHELNRNRDRFRFITKSGVVEVGRNEDGLVLDFPSRPGKPVPMREEFVKAVGGRPVEARISRDLMLIYETPGEIYDLKPDFSTMATLEEFAVIVTAPAGRSGLDFISRFFAPREGIPEDPVTGSAHSTLIPYWAERLAKNRLDAEQVSARTGRLYCRYLPETQRVNIAGRAVTYLRGKITI